MWPDDDGLIQILDGSPNVFFHQTGIASIDVSIGEFRIYLKRFIVVGNCAVEVFHRNFCDAPVVVDRRIIGIKFDRPVVVRNGFCIFVQLKIGQAPVHECIRIIRFDLNGRVVILNSSPVVFELMFGYCPEVIRLWQMRFKPDDDVEVLDCSNIISDLDSRFTYLDVIVNVQLAETQAGGKD